MISRKAALATAIAAASFGFAAVPANAQWFTAMDFYLRGEAGAGILAENRGHWWGPGGPPGDPRILFNLDGDTAYFGSIALGAEISTGVRGEVALSHLGGQNIDANWIAPAPVLPDTRHADINADVSSWTFMANLFVEPLALAGYNSPIRPFVTGGVGFAVNRMDEWTRYNPEAAQVVRRWDGNTQARLAWSVGGGVSASLGDLFGTGTPVEFDLTYRYMDLGNVKGGGSPTFPGPPPSNSPYEPFNFDLTNHVVSVGLRIPFSSGR